MTNNKPWTIKLMIVLFKLKLFFLALILIAFGIVKDIDTATKTFGAGIKEALVKKFNLDMSDTAFALGTLIGTNLIPAIVACLGIVFIQDKKYVPTFVVLIIDILIGLGMMPPFLAIINLILFLQKKSKNYMKEIDEAVGEAI